MSVVSLFQVPFTDALDLVRSRKVYLENVNILYKFIKMLSSNHQAIFLSDFLIVLWPLKLEKCRLIFILRSTCDMNDNESDANIA